MSSFDRQMPSQIVEAHEALLQFLYLAPIGLAQTTLAGDIELVNPMSAQMLMPLSPDGNLANLFDVLSDVVPGLRERVGAFGPATGVICESVRLRLDADGSAGGRGPKVLSLSLLKLDEVRLMAVVSDATLEVEREEQGLARRLSDAARTDTLTQMPNRAAARDWIGQALDGPVADARFAVLFINCDRFKDINDTLGHAAGNEVLGMMADRLRSVLRAGRRPRGDDDSPQPAAARVGGDEFVVLLDDLQRPDDVHAVARRLLDTLALPYGVGRQQVRLSASVGVVLPAQAAGDADAVLQDASIAMVEAKRAGGARHVVFEPAMRDRAARRGGLATELHLALAEGQLFVVYQPVVGLQGVAGSGVDARVGVEALVRWRHPTRGLVPPLDFIPVAEECGLIGAVGDFVLETACRQWVAWQRRLGATDAPRHLAVNLSRAQLVQPGAVDRVGVVLRRTGMPAGRLQLEVTESLAAQDEAVQARLHDLKALGLTLALDDFGTGYSSLASLHQFPVDTVKIDRSFVCRSHESHHHRVLIEATVRVANSLGMSTVAEGIETAAQAEVVRSLGCDKGQGYFFSGPVGGDDVERWLFGRRGERVVA